MKRKRAPQQRLKQQKELPLPAPPQTPARALQATQQPTWPAVVTAISTVLLAAITSYYAYLTHGLLKQAERSLQLSHSPSVSIGPEQVHGSSPAVFSLELVNQGLSDLVDVRVFEDHYVAVVGPTERLSVVRFGTLNINPQIAFASLLSGRKATILVDFSHDYSEMVTFYSSDEVKGQKMQLLRVLVQARRALDGQAYSAAQLYIVAGHGDYLLPYSERGASLPGLAVDQLQQLLNGGAHR